MLRKLNPSLSTIKSNHMLSSSYLLCWQIVALLEMDDEVEAGELLAARQVLHAVHHCESDKDLNIIVRVINEYLNNWRQVLHTGRVINECFQRISEHRTNVASSSMLRG